MLYKGHVLLFFIGLLISSKLLAGDLLIEDPVKLKEFESSGLSFSSLLFSDTGANNKKLLENAAYNSLVVNIESDLQLLKKNDALLGVGMQYSHRLFDIRWLKSPHAKFELVGIVNRMDRAIFNPNTCGELRLIYRLGYEKKQNNVLIKSRLPMTANVVYKIPATPGCKASAALWSTQLTPSLKLWSSRSNLKSLEINLQATRWPSTIRGDQGGHAEYFLRVYNLEGNTFIASPLENTPDVAKLVSDQNMRKELLGWLLIPENVKALDAGTLNIPQKFLTKSVSSFALHGMNRLSNRPFDQIFKKEDFASVDFSSLTKIYGPSSFRRRLNDLSCVGCHQGRTIAGFHFLGRDSETTTFANSIFSSQSSHMIDEQKRRQTFFQNIYNGKPADVSRPFSERSLDMPGDMNAHCGLPGSEYEAWTCGYGFKCKAVVTPATSSEIGECLPDQPIAGNPCEPGVISQRNDSHQDILKAGVKMNCASHQHCEATKVGFPAGMCSGGCGILNDNEACGSIAILHGFNECLARNRPFEECLVENIRPASLQKCDEDTACRADYVCNKTKSGTGVCIPPYFLFQLRLDGHPKPE